jgi:hypothetical protein
MLRIFARHFAWLSASVPGDTALNAMQTVRRKGAHRNRRHGLQRITTHHRRTTVRTAVKRPNVNLTRPGDQSMTTRIVERSAFRFAFAALAGSLLVGCAVSAEEGESQKPDIEKTSSPVSWSNGFHILSDSNPSLYFYAYPADGAAVTLDDCSPWNCLFQNLNWLYEEGMIRPAMNPSLAIVASGGVSFGAPLVLASGCTAANPLCTWTLKRGEFRSDANPAFAINAYGGAGTGELKVHDGCNPNNVDCTFTIPNAMFAANSNSLAFEATAGLVGGSPMKLSNSCSWSNPNCVFSITHGAIRPATNPYLGILAGTIFNPATLFDGSPLSLSAWCGGGSTISLCQWTFNRGNIIYDFNPSFAMNSYGGVAHGTVLAVHSACPGNPHGDCMYNER